MAITSELLPNSNAAVGTGIGDGTNYVAWIQPQRIHNGATGASAAVVTSAGRGTLWSNCFDSSQIPSDATITGVEIVAGLDSDGSGNSNIGNSGATGVTESITFQLYLHNGTDYSSPLVFTHALGSGLTLNGDSDELTATGPNTRYANTDSTVDTLAGSTTSLSGLSWAPANQASFGFAITTIAVSATPVAIASRGLGMRVTYNTVDQYTNTIMGVAPADILKVYGVTTANVEFRSTPGNTVEPAAIINLTYQFESETNVVNTSDWSPSGSSAGWVNGSSAVDGTYWGRDSNKNVKGWNMDSGTTGSGNTGPNGGVDPSDGSHESAEKYMYTESSSGRNAYAFVARLAIPDMNDTSNDLDLKFWVHAFGAAMGDLYVYIDDASASNHSSATELAAYETFSGFTATSSVWQQKTISLNSYRDNSTDYYIYFVSQNGTSFTSDLAIDAVQLIES